jgi:hypothetical protein
VEAVVQPYLLELVEINMVHQADLVVAEVTIVVQVLEGQVHLVKEIMEVTDNKTAAEAAEAEKVLQVRLAEAVVELEVLVDSIQQLLLQHHQEITVIMRQEVLAETMELLKMAVAELLEVVDKETLVEVEENKPLVVLVFVLCIILLHHN